MKDRPYIQRGLFRRALRRHKSTGSDEQQEMIQAVLSDRALFETAYEQAIQRAETFAADTGEFRVLIDKDGTPIVDNLLKLLNWFIENGPELVQIIELIIGLFGGISSVMEVMNEDAQGASS